MPTQLTPNFTREEFTRVSSSPVSGTAEGNLFAIARLSQAARDVLGVPLEVTSWYRSPGANSAAGGADNSQHLVGGGVDLKPKGLTNRAAADKLLAARRAGTFPAFGQLIWYSADSHFHLSLGSKSEVLANMNGTYLAYPFAVTPADATKASKGGTASLTALEWLGGSLLFLLLLWWLV